MGRLSTALVSKARNGQAAAGRYRDGQGLILNVTPGGSASWMLRYHFEGRRRDMGLGSVRHIGLGKARELAAAKIGALKGDKLDPLAARTEARAVERRNMMTFDKAAEAFLAAQEPSWKNPKHRQQWRNTLSAYASPVIGGKAVADITTEHLLEVLRPIWERIPETANRLRGRVEVILDWAKARGFRSGENPARWRGHMALMLPATGKLKTTKHHAAVPVDALPGVYQKLARSADVAAAATRFTILCAARPGEAAGATWDEIDLAHRVWTVPPHRQKARKPHRVPLSDEAMAVLAAMAPIRTGPHSLVFPGGRKGRPLTLPTLAKALRRAGGKTATVHGTSRSSFDDWGSERTAHPQKLIDRALAHGPKSPTIASYRRSDLLAARAALMSDWARFLHGA
jgi:integrase